MRQKRKLKMVEVVGKKMRPRTKKMKEVEVERTPSPIPRPLLHRPEALIKPYFDVQFSSHSTSLVPKKIQIKNI